MLQAGAAGIDEEEEKEGSMWVTMFLFFELS
jgi:hypothetical protein